VSEKRKKVHLSEQPNRLAAVTDREIACILGGLIGGLAQHCAIDKVRRAVQWWAENDEAWDEYERLSTTVSAVISDPRKKS
tara:strand:+ start:832 stop:1074 length:243 start_codon:yes stop_codon:yes gene_type:complete